MNYNRISREFIHACLCGTLLNNPLMNPRARILAAWSLTAIVAAFACTDVCPAADNNPVRQPTEDVNSPELRRKAGLQPNESLLFNGWGVTPAGDQVPVSDLTLKLVISPDKKRLMAVSGGFGKHGVTLLDLANR